MPPPSAPPRCAPPSVLASIAAGLAATLEDDATAPGPGSTRAFRRLLHTEDCEAWLIAWRPGADLALHDHGGSTGAVLVVQGGLMERSTDRLDPRPPQTVRVPAREPLAIEPTRIHGLWNPGPSTAVSVHVYSPPLATMTFYDPRPPDARPDRQRGGPGMTTARIDTLLDEARRRLPRRPTADELPALRARNALLVDIRPSEQRRRDGELAGAVVVDRNVLEWRLDPTSPHRIPEAADHDREVVVVCNEGYASSLAALSLQELGFHRATDLDGGIQAVLRAELP